MKRYTRDELRLLICCFFAYTAAYICRCNLSPSLDAIAKAFGISDAQVGLLPTCFAVPYAAGQIFSGLLADRLPAPRLMLVGLLGSAVVNFLFSFCPAFGMMLALWFLNGILQSLIWTPIVRIMAIHFRDEVRDNAVFFISLTLIFGYLAAWALSGFLTSRFSWRAAFRASGLVTAVIAVPSILGMRGKRMQLQARSTESVDRRAPVGHLFLHTNLALLLIGCFGNGYVRDGITNWATKLLMDTQGIDLSSAVGIILIIPTVNFLGIQLGRLAYRKTGKDIYRASGLLFAACAALCGALAPASRWNIVTCVLTLVMTSAMTYGLNPLLTSLMPMLFRRFNRVALAAGVIDAMIYVGSAFSGTFAGYLSDRFGWVAVFVSWMIVSLASTASMFAARALARQSETSF